MGDPYGDYEDGGIGAVISTYCMYVPVFAKIFCERDDGWVCQGVKKNKIR